MRLNTFIMVYVIFVSLVDHFLDGLRIQEHANKTPKEMSGGTKRKLSYALSMLGSPRAVLMDEPR